MAVTFSKAVATQAAQNRHQMARLKAKGKLRRVVFALPFVGVGAGIYFEESDRRHWLEANPGKTTSDYACEMGVLMAEVIEEVRAELPEWARDRLPEAPECEREAA